MMKMPCKGYGKGRYEIRQVFEGIPHHQEKNRGE
jgi:hypothetical protein